jgi:hypothetical protein
MTVSRRDLLRSTLGDATSPTNGDDRARLLPSRASPLPLTTVRLTPSRYMAAVEANRRYVLGLEPDRLLHELTGRADYAAAFDYCERAHLKHVLAQQEPSTGAFTYMTPLLAGAARVRWTRARWTPSCWATRPRSRRAALRRCAALAAALSLAACTSLGGGPRPATTSVTCARAAVDEVVTPEMNDKRKHCVGAGNVARRCSVFEARLAYYGKEFVDALGAGDPELEDLRADRAGLACARRDPDPAAVLACCTAAGY